FEVPRVVAWGAQWILDPSVLHASMLALRAVDFLHATSFRPRHYPHAQRRDTAGHACDELRLMGFRLVGLPRELEARGWSLYGTPALWAHLGSGTFAVRPAWPRRLVRSMKARAGHRMAKKAILREQRRAAFLAWGRRWLGTPPVVRAMIHGRPHEGKMVEDHR